MSCLVGPRRLAVHGRCIALSSSCADGMRAPRLRNQAACGGIFLYDIPPAGSHAIASAGDAAFALVHSRAGSHSALAGSR